MCGKCREKFNHKTSLIRHIKSEHINQESSDESDTNSLGDDSFVSGIDHGLNAPGNVVSQTEAAPLLTAEDTLMTPTVDLKSEAARFLLKLRSSGNITNASLSLVVDSVTWFAESVLHDVKKKTSDYLQNSGLPPEAAAEFLSGETFTFENPFNSFQTIQDQLEYCQERFGLVIPQKHFLYFRLDNRFDHVSRMFLPTQVPATFQYISLIDTLTMVVRNPYLRNLILCEEPSVDGVLRSDKDGSDFRNNEFFKKYPQAIRIVLYYDDLEIANGLGSKDVIHSLGCFYFSILNLPPEETSLLSSIFLLALCYAQDLKEKGAFAKILTPFILEIKQLQTDQGVVIDLREGGTFTLRASVTCLSADALAAHAMLGLLSPSALMFCRACLVSINEFKLDSTVMGSPRTTQVHEQHVKLVERNVISARKYGVKERSPLSSVMRVPEDSIFDAFHDVVGVAQMIMKLALYEFICVKEFFSVQDFNSFINMFNYGASDLKNKPSPNFTREKLYSKGHTLKQYGSQTFCLLRIFPFVVPGVSEGDKYLELVHFLQDIVKIMFSHEVRENDIARLEVLVYQFAKLFHETCISLPTAEGNEGLAQSVGAAAEEMHEYDICDEDEADNEEEEETDDNECDDSVIANETPSRRRSRMWKSRKLKKGINKLHHLFHCADQMRRKGPVRRLWCERFEGRHRILRKHAAVQSNFKNPPMTMARMFQLSTLDALLARGAPRKMCVAESDSVNHTVRHSPYSHIFEAQGMVEDMEIKVATSVEVYGTKYEAGLFVQLKNEDCLQPLFALITKVIVDSSETSVFFIVNKCCNTPLSARYNAYQVQHDCVDMTSMIVNQKDLAHHRPIAPWSPVRSTALGTYFLYPRTVLV